MKTTDLMIGDFVTFRDCLEEDRIIPIRITALRDCDNHFLAQIDGDDISDELELDDEIVGIPLTPEILEKNGFSNNYAEDDLCYATDAGGDIIGVHIVAKKGTMDEMYFNYAHELQMALRCAGLFELANNFKI